MKQAVTTPKVRSNFSSSRRIVLALAAASALAGMAPGKAVAQDLTFNPGTQLPIGPRYGEWNTTVPAWYNGTTHSAWTSGVGNTANATFLGGVAEVTTAEDLGVGSITLLGNTTLLPPQTGPGARVINLNNNSVINTGAFTLNSVANLFSGTLNSTVTKTGAGVLIVHRGTASGTNAAGTLAINQGTVGFANSSADLANTTWVNIASGATLDMAYFGGPIGDTFGMFSGAGNLKLGTFTNLGVNVGSALAAGTANTATGTYSGTISGGGRFAKLGTGTTVFTGTNTYTGPTSVQSGVLRLEGGTTLADTNDVFLSNVAGVQLQLANNEVIGSLGGGGATGGVVDIGANTLTVGDSNIYNGFGGNFTGTGTVVKRGTGLWSIQNTTPVSTFGGKYRVEGGILSMRDDVRFGAVPGALVADYVTLAGGTLANSNAGGGTWNANRGITVSSASSVLVLGSSASNLVIDGQITGSGGLSKYGDGTLSLGADNSTFSGNLTVRDGGVSTFRGLGTPFGTGAVDLAGSTINVAPGAAGISVAHTMASGSGKTFAFGPGAILNLNKNAGNTELKLTVGDAAATSSSLVRNARGTLVLQANTGIALLGTVNNERVFVNGGVDLVNGIAPGVIGTTGGAGTTTGEFLTYNTTDGLKVATYTSTDITTSAATDVVSQTANATLANPAQAFALKLGDGVSGAALDLGGKTLTVGSGSNPAMVIVNTLSSINNGTVDFGTRQGVVYSQASAGNVSATLTGSNGMAKVGVGSLNLTTAATYTGATHISQGAVVLGGNDLLPTTTDLTIENKGVLNLGANSQRVASLSGNRTANILTTAGGKLTVGAGSSTYLGTINNGVAAASATGTLEKDGAGTLTLGVANSQTGNDSESSTYQKLVVKNGGVVSVGSTLVLPVASQTAGVPVADTMTLDGGTLRISSVNSAGFGSGGASTYTLSGSSATLRGLTLGAGGGTIEVSEAKEIVLFQRGNGAVVGTDDAPLITGSSTMYKTGPGFLRLGIGNDASFTGKWVIKDGNLQFQDGRCLGTAASYTPDFLTLDGGMIQNNGTGTFTPNQGITIGAGGGTLNASWVFSQEFRGNGTLTKITTSTASFNAPSPLWTSPISLLTGFMSANASDALGTGTITISPAQQTGLFKLSGTADSVLTNPITLNVGSTIDFRVDALIGALVLNGNISGAAGFIKTGGTLAAGQGTLVLGGNNTFAGDVIIDGGAVRVNSNTALGAASGVVMINPGASLEFDNAAGINHATNKSTYVAGTGLLGAGAIRNVTGNNTYAGSITVTQDSSIEIPGGNLNLTGSIRGASALTVNGVGSLATGGMRVTTLNVNNPRVSVNAGRSTAKTSKISTLNLGANTLDLNDNDLVVSNTNETAVGALVTSGYAAGAWSGPGITSTVAAAPANANKALGYNDAADVLGAGPYPLPFSGVSVDSAADVLVRYTYRGDINLDGQVSSTDFTAFVAVGGYGTTAGALWGNGDFDYDGKVNTVDFNYLAGNFGAAPIASALPSDLPGAGASLGSVVPEPSSLSVLALGVAGLVARRRKA